MSSVREREHLSPSLLCREFRTRAKAHRRRCEVNEGGRAGEGEGAGHDLLVARWVRMREREGASSSSSNLRRPRRVLVLVALTLSLEVVEDERRSGEVAMWVRTRERERERAHCRAVVIIASSPLRGGREGG